MYISPSWCSSFLTQLIHPPCSLLGGWQRHDALVHGSRVGRHGLVAHKHKQAHILHVYTFMHRCTHSHQVSVKQGVKFLIGSFNSEGVFGGEGGRALRELGAINMM